MGFIGNIVRKFSTKDRRSSPIVDAITHLRTGLPHKDHRQDILNLERWLTSWVYICTDRNAVASAQMPIRMFRRDSNTNREKLAISGRTAKYLKSVMPRRMTEDATEIMSHPFLDVLRSPNPIFDQYGLIWLTAAHIQLSGVAYWHVPKGSGGGVPSIWPLPSQFVYPIFGDGGQIFKAYEFRMGNKRIKLPADEVVVFRKPSPLDSIGNFGNLRGIIDAAETNVRMIEYERALFENNAVPDILISAKSERITGAQMNAIRESWIEQSGGWLKAGLPAVAPVEIEVTKLGSTIKELQFGELRNLQRDEIAAGFGVPLPVIKSDGTPFNNQITGISLWKRNTIAPILLTIAETINCRLMPRYTPREGDATAIPPEPPWFIQFDDPVPEDIDAEAERTRKEIADGTITINEARERIEHDPVAWGHEPWINAGLRQPSQIEAETAQAQAITERQTAATEQATAAQVAAGETAARLGDANDARLQDASTADPIVEPPTFAELVALFNGLADRGDKDGANLTRALLAQRMGGDLTPLKEILAAQAPATVNPDDQPENPNAEDPEQGEEETEAKDAKDEKGGDKDSDNAKGKANGGGDDGDRVPSGDPRKRNAAIPRGGGERPGRREADSGTGVGRAVGPIEGGYITKVMEVNLTKIDREIMDPEAHPDNFASVVNQLMTALETQVQSNAPELAREAKRLADVNEKLTNAMALQSLFDEAEAVEAFVADMKGVIGPLVFEGSTLAAYELGARGVRASVLEPAAVEHTADVFARTMAKQVVETMQADVIDVVMPILTADPSSIDIVELNKQLAEKLPGEKKAKVEMIARTEVNNALNAGAADTYIEAGIKQHEWLASVGACQFCETLNGKRVKVGAPFVTKGTVVIGTKGGRFKANFKDVVHPTLHPHCVCTIVPVIE